MKTKTWYDISSHSSKLPNQTVGLLWCSTSFTQSLVFCDCGFWGIVGMLHAKGVTKLLTELTPTQSSHTGQVLGEAISISVLFKCSIKENMVWNHLGYTWDKSKYHGWAKPGISSCCVFTWPHLYWNSPPWICNGNSISLFLISLHFTLHLKLWFSLSLTEGSRVCEWGCIRRESLRQCVYMDMQTTQTICFFLMQAMMMLSFSNSSPSTPVLWDNALKHGKNDT